MKTHNYFYDFEFNSRFSHPFFGNPIHTIDLISIGIVDQNNREYYAVGSDFNPVLCNKWQQENVLKPLIEDFVRNTHGDNREEVVELLDNKTIVSQMKMVQRLIGKTNDEIAEEIIEFMNPNEKRYNQFGEYILGTPVLYGYYSAYDHVLLASLFGTMEHYPKFLPYYTRDVQQMIDDMGIDKEELLKQVPQTNDHVSRYDSQWIKRAHEYILNLKK